MELDQDTYHPKMKISPELFVTKREFLSQNIVPACPVVPPKLKRFYGKFVIKTESVCEQAKLLKFIPESEVRLSTWYRSDSKKSYFDQVFYQKFKMGEGSFGSVYKAICRDDDQLYAIKHFNRNHPKSTRYIEVENMEKVGFHKNLLKYFMAWEEDENIYIKMECCQMSLAQYSKINHDIPEDQLHEILHDVINGLDYIHSKNLVHLDVKPDNILMEKGHYKLGDFGLLFNMKSSDKSERLSSEGDSKYLAPELLNRIYTPKADIFALGVTLLELATDYIMPSNGCVWHAIRAGGLPSNLTERISPKLASLIGKMMKYDSESRPSANQIILNCSIIQKVINKDLSSPRTDYAALLATETQDFPNVFDRIFNNNNNSAEDLFQTPINRNVNRKIAFSLGGDVVPRRMKTGSSPKEHRRSPRMKLFL